MCNDDDVVVVLFLLCDTIVSAKSSRINFIRIENMRASVLFVMVMDDGVLKGVV